MGEQYRLRIGDGTVLTIDRAGLGTWLLDGKAMVQAPGSRRWRPLRKALEEGLPEEPLPAPVKAPMPATPPPAVVAPSVAPPEPKAPVIAPATANVAASLEDEDPPFHVSTDSERQSLLDVALAEVERHGGRDHVWEWTPPAAPPPAGATASPPSASSTRTPARASSEALQELEIETEDVGLSAAPVDPIAVAPIAVTPIAVSPVPGPPAAVTPTAAAPSARLAELWPAVAKRVEALLRPLPRVVDAVIDRVRRWRMPRPAVAGSSPAPVPPGREIAQPPPSLSDLPVLRFAPTDEDEASPPAVRRQAAPRARSSELRTLLAAGLAGLAVVAYSTRTTWLPASASRARATAARPLPPPPPAVPEPSPLPKEVQAAVDQLPHLSLDTIELVMSRSERGLPEPPEVFRRAHEAAGRGASVLAPEEAEELQGLERSVLAALPRKDRDRVRAYDRASRVRYLLVAEDARVLALYARGVRALPVPRRERMKVLLGRAIAAELGPRTASAER